MVHALFFASVLAVSLPAQAHPDPESVVREMFDAFNAHDPERMAALYAEEAVLTSSDFCAPRGKSDVVRTYRALFDTFPDIRDDIDRLIADGDQVAVAFTARSAQGPAGLELPVIAMLRVEQGRIVHDASIFETGDEACSR